MIANLRSPSHYDRILQLLDLERKVIVNGPLSGLKELVEKREAVLGDILAQDPSPPEDFLAALRAKAERNSRLILASLAGIKAANAQIDQIREIRDQLRTYTATGTAVERRNSTMTRDQRA